MAEQIKTAPKPKKKKGPIRWEAIGPIFIVIFLIWAYFFFFFDSHVRWAIQHFGTNAVGAEVDVADVNTSFWNASLAIKGIQVTDKTAPEKNMIQIGDVIWGMSWDALLRGKIVIEKAAVLEIAVGAPRTKPGRVLPPEPPSGESAFDKVRATAMAKAETELKKNVLGDLATVLNGNDPTAQLKNIGDQLKSSAKIKELDATLKTKQAEWQKRLAELPQQKDIDSLQTRFKKVKLGGYKDVGELQSNLQELDSIIKEADAKVKAVQSTAKAVGDDTNSFKTSLTDLNSMVQADVKDLEGKLKLPSLDVASLSRSIFGPLFLDRVKQAEFYMNKARDYMPPKKTEEEKAYYAKPEPHEREKGRDYKFGRPHAYPKFWLKKAQLSSKATKGADYSGDVVGTVENVTDNPPLIGLPITASFLGDFPKQELFGVNGKITIDHTTNVPVEKVNIKVARFNVIGKQLVDSPEVKLGFVKAGAGGTFDAEMKEGTIVIATNLAFEQLKGSNTADAIAKANAGGTTDPAKVDKTAASNVTNPINGANGAAKAGFLYAQAQQPMLNEILNAALSDIPKVTLDASVKGPWTALRFDINSNLGQELARAFDKQIQAKIQEARAKIEAMVNEKVGAEREKLTAQFNQIKGQTDGAIKEKQTALDKQKSQMTKAKSDAEKSAKKGLEKEGQKAVDDIRKKLGF
jgi:uncharacterized protein (TIGR03545 family)